MVSLVLFIQTQINYVRHKQKETQEKIKVYLIQVVPILISGLMEPGAQYLLEQVSMILQDLYKKT